MSVNSTRDITVSAPGKVILHGEHAVVYGKRAIASCLDLRTFLRLHPTNSKKVVVCLPDIQLQSQWDTEELLTSFQHPFCDVIKPAPPSSDLLKKIRNFAGLTTDTEETKQLAIVAFLYLYCSICYSNGTLASMDVHIASTLPTSAGLGSSAAFSTSLAASLLTNCQFIKSEVSPADGNHGGWSGESLDLINKWAYQAEKIIHGNPSGIDNSVSCYGGALNFQGGNITPLKCVPTLRVLLFNTKVPRSTKALVAGVRDRYDKYPAIIQPVLESMEAISLRCEELFSEIQGNISSDNYKSLQDLIDVNQHLLAALGVSHSSLDQICQIAATHNLKAKLTGAGGGGCAFALLPPDFSSDIIGKIQQEMKDFGWDCWETMIGGLGVMEHFKIDGDFTIPKSFKQFS